MSCNLYPHRAQIAFSFFDPFCIRQNPVKPTRQHFGRLVDIGTMLADTPKPHAHRKILTYEN